MKNILKSFGYIVVYCLIVQAVMLAISLSGVVQGRTDLGHLMEWGGHYILLGAAVANTLAISIVYLVFQIKHKSMAVGLKIRRVGIRQYLLPVLAAFAFSMIFALLTEGMEFANSALIMKSNDYFSKVEPWLGNVMMVASLLVLAPLAEEIVFRGLVMTELQKSFYPVAAILISALMFGGMHIIGGGPLLGASSALLGVILGIVYMKTESLLPAMAAHMSANLPDFIMRVCPESSLVIRIVAGVVLLGVFITCIAFMCRTSEA